MGTRLCLQNPYDGFTKCFISVMNKNFSRNLVLAGVTLSRTNCKRKSEKKRAHIHRHYKDYGDLLISAKTP